MSYQITSLHQKLSVYSRLSLACAAALLIQERANAAGTTYTLPAGSVATWEEAVWTRAGGTSINPFPNAVADIAQYLSGSAAITALDLTGGGPITVGEIIQGGAGLWTITAGSASGVVFDNTGVGLAAIRNTANGSLTIGASVTIQNTDLLVATGTDQTGTISLTGAIGGVGNLSLLGARAQNVITLGSVNNTGSVNVAVGSAGFTNTAFTIGSLGSNVTALVVGDATNPAWGGTLNVGASDFAGPITIQGAADLATGTAGLGGALAAGTIRFDTGGGTLTSSGGITTARSIDLGATGTFRANTGETIVLNGAITGTGNLVRSGFGNVILGGATSNSHSGDTVATAGSFTGQLSLQKTGGAIAVPGDLVLDATTGGTSVGVGTSANTRNQFGQQFGSDTVIRFTNTSASQHAYFNLYGTDQTVAGISEPTALGGIVQNSQTEAVAVDSVLTIDNSEDFLFAGYLRNVSNTGTGTLSLVKKGSGRQTLSGLQITYTGGTTLNEGTLELVGATGFASAVTFDVGSTGTLLIGGASQSIRGLASADPMSNTAIVENGASLASTLTINQAADTSFGGLVRDNSGGGTLAVTKTGAGTLTLTNNNTFNGPLTLAGGTVSVSSNDFLGGLGSVLTFSGGTLRVTGTDYTNFGPRLINSASFNGGLDIADAANTFDFYWDIGGAGGLSKSGAGTLLLTGTNNTYTGSTTINEGTLKLGQENALGGTVTLAFSPTAPTGTRLTMDGFNATVGSNVNSGLTSLGTGAIIENAGFVPTTFTVRSGFNSTYAGLIRDGGPASLSFTRGGGNSTLLLSGANTYTGVTTLESGTVSVTLLGNGGAASGIGAASSAAGNLVLDGGVLQYSGTVPTNTDRRFTLGVGGGGLDASGATSVDTINFTSTLPITFAGSGARTLTLRGSNTGDNILAAPITDGEAPTGLRKEGSGTWVLTSAGNNYTGATAITGGRLVVTGALTGSAVQVSGGGILAARGDGVTTGVIGSSTGTTGVTLAGGPAATRGAIDLVDGTTSQLTILATSATNGLTLGGIMGNASALRFEIGGAGAADSISLPAAKLLVNAGGARIDIAGLGGFGLGTYDLISFANGQASGLQSLYIGSTPGGGFSYSLQATPTGQQLLVSDVAISSSWTSASSGDWFTPGNWSGGNVPNGTGATATFALVNPGARTVTLNGGVALGTLNIDSSSGYTLASSGNSILAFNNNGLDAALNVTDGSHTISAPVALADATNVTVGGTSLTFSNAVSGTGALVKEGDGSLSLTAVNTFTGGLVINGGTVRVAGDSSMGAVPVSFTPNAVILNGGILFATAAMATSGTRGFLLGLDGGTIVASSGNINMNSVIADQAGPGRLTVGAGAGIYVPGGQSTYSGGTVVSPGAIVVPISSSIGAAGAPTSGPFGIGVVDLAGGQIRATTSSSIVLANAVTISADTRFVSTGPGTDRDLTFTGPVTFTGGTRTLIVDTSPMAGGVGTVFNGAIGDGGNGYGLIKTGDGRLVLGGANTFGGGLAIRSGTVTATNAGALGGGGTGAVTLGDSSGSASAALFGSGAITLANPLTVQAGSSGAVTLGNNGAGAVVFNGAVALDRAVTLVGDGTGSVTLGGAITGSSALTVTGSSGNFVQISGNNAAYTGDVAINSGTLRIGNAAALSASNAVTLNADAVLDLNNNSLTLRTLTDGMGGGGTVGQSGVNARTLTVGDGSDFSFSGSLTATTPGNLGLVKVGSGTLTLSGVSNYTGATAINGGTLLLDLSASSNGVLSSGSTLVLGGGKLLVQGRTGAFVSSQGLGGLTLAAGTGNFITIDPNGGTSAGLTLGNTWTRGAGSTLLLDLSAGNASVTSTPTAAVNGLLSFVLVQDTTGVGFGTVNGGQIVRLVGGTALTPTSNSATTNFTTSLADPGYSAGKLTLAAGTHATNSLSIDALPGTGTLDLGGTTLTFASGGLLMNGSGDYLIQNGTLGASGAELIVQQLGIGRLTVSGPISGGAGSLTKSGDGTLALTGTNTYTGVTAIQDGTLIVSGGNAIANAGQVTLANKAGAIFRVEASETIGSLIGGGTVGGEVVLASGTLTIGDGSSPTYSGTISGSGALTRIGAGIMTLGGANSYTGLTTVNGNAGLRITNGAALGDAGPGNVTDTLVSNLGRLELAGGITVNNETVTINGNGGADSSGALRASGSGVNTWTGDVIIGTTNARLGGTSGSTLVVSGNVLDGVNSFGLQIRTDNLASKVVLSGSANAWNGPTNVVVGTLQLAGGANRLPVGTTLQLGNNQNIGQARFDLNGQDQELAGLVSNGIAATGPTRTMLMDVSSATPATVTLTGNNNQTYIGTISGAVALTKGGTGIYSIGPIPTIDGANVLPAANTYTGATTVNGGTLRATSANAFSSASAFTLANTAGVTLDLANTNQAVGSLAGGGEIGGNVMLGSGSLTTGGNNASTTYGGVISGAGGLTKEGGGTFTVAGSNTYTGPTTVTGGTLEISGGISASTALNVTGGSLQLSVTGAVDNASNAVTLGTGGTLALASSLHGATETFGTLAVIGDATIDFGSVGFELGGNTLNFTNLTMGGHALSVTNWTGALGLDANPNSDPNQDRLLFGSGLSLSADQLASIRFFDDVGTFLGTGATVTFAGGYEIIPVPEPSAPVMLGVGGLLMLRRVRRRLAR